MYCIRNTVNQKVYVGKALCIYRRIKNHITNLNRKIKKQENDYLINAWHKHGRQAFEYLVLEYCEGEDLLKRRELHWQDAYACTEREKGYNLRMDSSTNIIVHEETRAKLRAAHKKRFDKLEERQKASERSRAMWASNPGLKAQVANSVRRTKQAKYKYLQYTKDMALLREWNTVEDIIRDNPDYKWQNIYAVCSGYKPTIYGYVWRKELKI